MTRSVADVDSAPTTLAPADRFRQTVAAFVEDMPRRFRRSHRPTVDLSQGWGGNSPWRTGFRLDYRTRPAIASTSREITSIDGTADLHLGHPNNLSPEERLLTPEDRRELLRHRCLLRAPEAADALAASPRGERDLMPLDHGGLPAPAGRAPRWAAP